MHNAPPPNMPQCGEFSWEPEEFRQKESSPSPFQPTRVPRASKENLYLGLMVAFIILLCFNSLWQLVLFLCIVSVK